MGKLYTTSLFCNPFISFVVQTVSLSSVGSSRGPVGSPVGKFVSSVDFSWSFGFREGTIFFLFLGGTPDPEPRIVRGGLARAAGESGRIDGGVFFMEQKVAPKKRSGHTSEQTKLHRQKAVNLAKKVVQGKTSFSPSKQLLMWKI